jgi:ubiquinone biosynthesis protein
VVVDQRPDAVSDWDGFFDSLDFGALVPEAYERYRPAIVDGLNFFLENLAADRTMEILVEQASMPSGTSIEERLVAIARRCPALHKLGQVLARDRRLPADFRRLLQNLESMPSTLTTLDARRLAEAELGPLSRLRIDIDEPPLAEASVAIVVPFTSRSTCDQGAHGVLKLLKPGIEEKLEEELELLQRIGALLDDNCQSYQLPQIDYEDTFIEVRALLSREICLDREQENMRHARREFSDVSSVIVPEVYDFSTPRLTAMQRIIGTKVTDADLPASGRRKLADTIIQALLARPIWSKVSQAVFHADPHAGNLFATAEGRLGVLDWSLVGHLTKDDRVQLTQVLIGAFTLDTSRVCEAIDALAQGRTDATSLDEIVHQHMALVSQGGGFPGLSWMMRLLDESVTRARCRFGGDLVMFRKVLQTLEGVVADVSPDCHPDRVLIGAFVKQLVIEWAQRPFVLPSSRHFATHFSNVDLTQLLMSVPFIGSRQWVNLQATWLHDTGLAIAR